MTTKTKCTITLCVLFIIEIFPLPFTAFISLYVIRKRPKWFPGVVTRLYEDRVFDKEQTKDPLEGADAMKTRKFCTITLSFMTVADLILPLTIPVGLYIVRRRPRWFKNVAKRLYMDLNAPEEIEESIETRVDLSDSIGALDNRPHIAAAQLKKHLEIERNNQDYAHSTAANKSIKLNRNSL